MREPDGSLAKVRRAELPAIGPKTRRRKTIDERPHLDGGDRRVPHREVEPELGVVAELAAHAGDDGVEDILEQAHGRRTHNIVVVGGVNEAVDASGAPAIGRCRQKCRTAVCRRPCRRCGAARSRKCTSAIHDDSTESAYVLVTSSRPVIALYIASSPNRNAPCDMVLGRRQ